MFENLPATAPPKTARRKSALIWSGFVHLILVATIITIQMVAPDRLGGFEILTSVYMAPPPPPPAPLPPPPASIAKPKAESASNRDSARVQPVAPRMTETPPPATEPALVAPTEVPADIARVIDVGPGTGGGVGVAGGIPGGVPGGVRGGLIGGSLDGVLGGLSTAPLPIPPEPVRVGGNIREPKVLSATPPLYPQEAKRARVQGVVLIEATVTERGTVEKLKVISGHPLLVDAAVKAVEKWKYEPTILNGAAVPVILTASVKFALAQ